MSTKFYIGQKDYIANLNELDDLFTAATGNPTIGIAVAAATAAQAVATAAQAVATAQATNALASAGTASSQALVANTAAGVAAGAAKLFVDDSAGLAATAEGGYYSIPSGIGDEVAIIKRKVGGLAVDTTKRTPSVTASNFSDRSIEQFVYGGQVLTALTDNMGRALAVWLLDGVQRGKLGLSAASASSVGLTFSNTTGLTTIDTPLLPKADVPLFINGEEIIGALTDLNAATYLAMEKSGKTYIPNLRLDTLMLGGVVIDPVQSKPVTDALAYSFQEERVNAVAQIIRRTKASGQRSQITSTSANYAPAISRDGSNVIYTTSRTAPASLYYQPVTGGAEYPYESTKLIVPIGNSISTVSQGYVTALATLRPTETLSVQGVSGQRTDDMAYRLGAFALTGSITGGSIPASGGVAITGLDTTLFRRTSGSASVKVRISGIAGVLSFATSAATFTRDVSGTATAVTNPIPIAILSGFIDGSINPSAQLSLDALLSGTAILVTTYNDIKEVTYTQSATMANLNAIVALLKPLVKRVIVVGDCIGQGRLTAAQFPANPSPPPDAATSQLWIDRSLSLNAAVQAAYPDSYLDMQSVLVATGYSSVFNVNGTNYTVINNTVFPDGIHPTGSGSSIFAGVINNIFTSRGW